MPTSAFQSTRESGFALTGNSRLIERLRPHVASHGDSALALQTRQRLPRIRACIDYRAEWLAGRATPGPPGAPPSSG